MNLRLYIMAARLWFSIDKSHSSFLEAIKTSPYAMGNNIAMYCFVIGVETYDNKKSHDDVKMDPQPPKKLARQPPTDTLGNH